MTHPKQKNLVGPLAALALCGLLVACDRAPDARNKEASSSAQVAASASVPAHPDSEVSAANTPSVEEAHAFILSRLTQQSLSNGRFWTPSEVSLTAQRWAWKELQVTTALALGFASSTAESEQYEVDPRALSVPVRVDGSTVKFECALTKCIHVQTSVRTMTTADEEASETNSSEQRAGNTWYFSSEQEAARVATAMNLALTRYGARARVF